MKHLRWSRGRHFDLPVWWSICRVIRKNRADQYLVFAGSVDDGPEAVFLRLRDAKAHADAVYAAAYLGGPPVPLPDPVLF